MVAAAFSHIQIMEEEESQWDSLSDGYKYVPRTREIMDQRLKALDFIDPCKYESNVFRRRFKIQLWVFNQIMRDVANHDPYFVKKKKKRYPQT